MAQHSRKRPRPSDLSSGEGLQPFTRSKLDRLPESSPTETTPLTLTELIKSRASELGVKDQPTISYPSSGTQYVDYTPARIDKLAEMAAIYYSASIPQRESSDHPVEVVALLGPSTFAYFITLLGLSRLGHTVLFLSARLSDEAHVLLLRITKASILLVDNAYADTGGRVLKHIPDLMLGKLGSLEDFSTLTPMDKLPKSQLDPTRETHNIAYIIHSSGSTTLPRPNFITHAAALGNSVSPVKLVGFVTLPMFHMWGLGCIFRGITNRKRVYVYNAHLPLTTQHLIVTLKEHSDIQVLYTVPYALKLMAESDEGIKLLAGLETVLVGGSACPKPIGDKLVNSGVMLIAHLGTSETGQLMSSARPREDILEWDWLRPSEALLPYLRMEVQQDQEGIYELVILDGWPSKVLSNRDDGSYATKDLYERHPDWPKKNAWRYHARKDDTIVLSNGEKANPLLFEGVARESAAVSEAVVFGAQKPHLGLFVARSEPSMTDKEVVNMIWPSIAAANKVAPAHARLSKDMVRVLSPKSAARIRTTDKGSLIRAAFYKDLAEAIDAMYEEAEANDGLVLDVEGLRAWLLQHVRDVLQPGRRDVLREETDVFALGVDSLQASQIRSMIVRHIAFGSSKLGQNFVFDFPSVTAMASELYRMRIGSAGPEKVSVEERMQTLIDRYSSFARHTPMPSESTSGECVVITGATGSLGAHVVAQVAALDKVAKVVCLVRAASDEEAAQRIQDSLLARKVTADKSKVKVYASDFSQPSLGLSTSAYNGVAECLVSVVHCAWSVNFNMGLESFEQDCIQGTKQLLDLCLKARKPQPASFNFCSSISAVGDTPELEISEEMPESLSYAQKMGYAQSKLVTEHLCMNAAKSTGLAVRIMRVGQIVGDTVHGVWNAQEAVPMTLQSATTIGALPALEEQCSWLPVDAVAGSLQELSLSQTIGSDVFHIVNHHTFHWTQDLLPMLREAGLEFDAVSQREWVRRLREHSDPVHNPPYRLMNFFAAKYDRSGSLNSLTYESDKARAAAPSLAEAPVVNQDMMRLFLHYLRCIWASPEQPNLPTGAPI